MIDSRPVATRFRGMSGRLVGVHRATGPVALGSVVAGQYLSAIQYYLLSRPKVYSAAFT